MAERTVNWWVRVQVLLVTLLLIGMAAYRFFLTQPVGRLDSGLIALILFVIVLILSEAFDSFSVGKLLSFSRVVKEKEKEVAKLEERNAQLLAQLVTVTTHQSQSQSHTSVFGDYNATPRVEKASPEDVQSLEEAQATEEARNGALEQVDDEADPAPTARRMLNSAKIDQIGLRKYLELKQYDSNSVLEQAKLISDFRDLDSISNSPMVFDAFVRTMGTDIFVEVRRGRFVGPPFRDRLYAMLSKIDHYRRKKNVDAHLELVVVEAPSDEPRPEYEFRLMNEFQPALASGLLRLTRLPLTPAEEEDAVR